ncbi:MAG: hypothetical protein R2792_12075 [Saprospiraceae bacterium]
MLAPSFVKQMQQILQNEYEAFREALSFDTPVSVRLNPFKPIDGLREIGNLEFEASVPWHPLGYYLPERPIFTLDPLWHAGAYYVQEASSMFLYKALKDSLPPDLENPRILDMCASPGGKSTLLSQLTAQNGLLVSNEYVRSRVNPLRENLERWGPVSTGVLSADADAFERLDSWFDAVVVDAPCSGEGLFRKDPDAMREWSPAHAEACALRQQRILPGAVAALKPGGILIYSTCTYNALENEENVKWLCEKQGMEVLHCEVPTEWGIQENEQGYRFFPHHTRGEGFFLSILRKKHGNGSRHNPGNHFQHLRPLNKRIAESLSPWVSAPDALRFFVTPKEDIIALPTQHEAALLVLDKACNSKWFGTKMGTLKGKDFVPDHTLALSEIIQPDLPGVDLDLEQALLYLKKETFPLPPNTPKGWILARYKGLNLGWIKAMPNRMNNYLPSERRIRMSVPKVK